MWNADPPERWYAACTKPRQERIATENLKRQNFVVYVPQVRIERLKRQGIKVDREPLFPGYVLVQLALNDQEWRVINSTRGVTSLLTFGESGLPVPLPTKEVESIQERERAGKLFVSEIMTVRRGDTVRLKAGLAADKVGRVVFTKGQRVALLMHLLGMQTRVMVPLHLLELVHQRHPKM